ncbi:hypothetical protein LCGC14_0910350 [marine sediment metagenome]|uniref:Uncharacterized protein n=1 Tax=marine sediment metagenome TaxID=412755 RepID=A0A0F9RCQ5_9ZZZZ
MDEMIKDLRLILNKLEKMDDPTASEHYKDLLYDAVSFIEWAIISLSKL